MKDADKEQYLKRGPLAVSGVMKDLLRSQTPLMVSFSHGQFISRMLEADSEHIIFDLGSNSLDNESVLSCDEINVSAETSGAKVEFSLRWVEKTLFDDLPAFSAPLPALLWQIQRREFFRVSAPLDPAFYCHSVWPDGSKVRFLLQDLSLGGIGVLIEAPLPEGLNSGNQFNNLHVDLGEYGHFEVSATLMSIGERSIVTRKNETRVTPRLSFCFTRIEPVQARQLQQVIFALERLARDKANRFQL